MPKFPHTQLPNGDWFVPIEGFQSVLEFASESGYNFTLPSKADDDSDLYGLLVRHKLKDVYVVPDVIEPDAEA